MRILLSLAAVLTLTAAASAHSPHGPGHHARGHHPHTHYHGNPHPHPHPRWTPPPIDFRFEPIPPVGNRLPLSHRARYNRPSYVAGKIAYYIAPSSQEAMSWHEHVHRGSYRRHAGRIEPMYFYPKPWEVLRVGPRDSVVDNE
jgi:hypothetical protein